MDSAQRAVRRPDKAHFAAVLKFITPLLVVLALFSALAIKPNARTTPDTTTFRVASESRDAARGSWFATSTANGGILMPVSLSQRVRRRRAPLAAPFNRSTIRVGSLHVHRGKADWSPSELDVVLTERRGPPIVPFSAIGRTDRQSYDGVFLQTPRSPPQSTNSI
ncbi:MAG: hypothetical protein WCD12_06275 [Candidatus Binatus sp.]|jgi:hypothetical protein|uniref:hypothetical protein n=1 Tax=Candidatus Binatus sp. TaxID=2811406 RepID=UPI003C72CBA1